MKLEKKTTEQLVQKLNEAEDKSTAIVEVVEELNEMIHADLISDIREQSNLAKADEEYRTKLGLRTLTQDEKNFYGSLMDPKQTLTAKQLDIIPTTIVDNTLNDLRRDSHLLSLANFAPAGVRKWICASTTGKAGWGALDAKITDELSATIKSLNLEVGKLSAFLVIPKSIRELSYEFVDRYFMAVLGQAMREGLEDGMLNGAGQASNQPIGLFRKLNEYTSEGTVSEKTFVTTLTGFSPLEMAEALSTLTNQGQRSVSKVYLVCNPEEYFTHVAPALYGITPNGDYVPKSFIPIEPIPTPQCAKGKAGLVIPGHYAYGLTGVNIKEYDQTKAVEDANLIIAKAYANGLATDNNVCYCFNPTNLKPLPSSLVQVVGSPASVAMMSLQAEEEPTQAKEEPTQAKEEPTQAKEEKSAPESNESKKGK